jgi:hypothetical protein
MRVLVTRCQVPGNHLESVVNTEDPGPLIFSPVNSSPVKLLLIFGCIPVMLPESS